MFLPIRAMGRMPLADLRREFNRLFDELGADFPFSAFGDLRAYPALNLWEDADKVYAEAELPGMSLDDIEILVAGSELTIKGRRNAPETEKRTFHRQERWVGEFSRTISLPYEVDADRVEARLKDGVLLVTMPKTAGARARKIAVRAD